MNDSFMSADTLAGSASSDLVLRCYPFILLAMKMPKIDDKLRLQADFGQTDAICVEVLKNPATEEGILLKVMARGPFEQGQQVWIVDRDGSKVGATVDNVLEQTIDSEVTLSTVLPA
jgi:hypothetical protein